MSSAPPHMAISDAATRAVGFEILRMSGVGHFLMLGPPSRRSPAEFMTRARLRRAWLVTPPSLSPCHDPLASLHGFTQRRLLNRAKSVSVEYKT
jgi:hypothetical protein